jgi:mRNA interferase MazF
MGRQRMGVVTPKRFEVWIVTLDPTIGSEIKKPRPCVVISPDQMNLSKLNTVIIAPMTSTVRNYPTRVKLDFQGKTGQIALDQIRTIDKKRLRKKLGEIKDPITYEVLENLQIIFTH